MKESLKWQLLLVFLLVALAAYFAYPSQSKPFFRKGEIFEGCKVNPGLDLQGGSELILGFKGKLSSEQLREGITQAKDVIERRINSMGLKEPRVQSYGSGQLQIQLPGIDVAEVDRVKYIITTSGRLEFKLEAEPGIVRDWKNRKPQAPLHHRWYSKEAKGTEIAETVLVEDEPVLTGEHIAEAGWKHTMEQGIVITLKLDRIGSEIFADITGKYSDEVLGENNGRRLAIILDDRLESAPNLQSRITSGEAIISRGDRGFPQQEAEDMKMILRSGSFPAPLEIRSENTVGATLGKDAIYRGGFAFVLAVIIVALFMIIYYHFSGLISVIALVMNAILILGILSFFQATLTLPGIAGLILTMGMAVDANIIFYERIREEKERGRSTPQAFESGFARAFVTVFDANITTLIAALLLWWFGTGAIRGFAVTLSIGIITTLFTAYFATRIMLRFCLESGLIKQFSMFRLFSRPKINFMGKARLFARLSLIVVVVSLIIFFYRGFDKQFKPSTETFGIDFTGGTVLNLRFREPVNISSVRDAIKKLPLRQPADEAGSFSTAKYPDVEVQSILPPVTKTELAGINKLFARAGMKSQMFQIRTGIVQTDKGLKELETDLKDLFKEQLVQEPIPSISLIVDKDSGAYKLGYRLKISLNLEETMELAALEARVKELSESAGLAEPMISLPEGISATSSTSFNIYCKEGELEKIKWETSLKKGLNLPEGPFPQSGVIGKTISMSLQRNAVIAIILSWIGMILYLAFRFELKYGIAAVVALIHDVLVCLGITVLFNWLVPDTWGINVELNFISVAAFMAIIGYSVNDSIVIFDRIRENLTTMKREPLSNIINISVNQTLSRTILTSLTSFLTVAILFGITARSGGGIPSFAFPVIIGTMVGCYSTIFIASPLIKAWGEKRSTT